MSILEAVSSAREVSRGASRSQTAWNGLTQEERDAITVALTSGDVGPHKLSAVLKKNDVNISKYFLDSLVAK